MLYHFDSYQSTTEYYRWKHIYQSHVQFNRIQTALLITGNSIWSNDWMEDTLNVFIGIRLNLLTLFYTCGYSFIFYKNIVVHVGPRSFFWLHWRLCSLFTGCHGESWCQSSTDDVFSLLPKHVLNAEWSNSDQLSETQNLDLPVLELINS